MLCDRAPPRRATLQHRIQDREQLAHTGRERRLLRLPRLTEALIERPNDSVPPRGDQRGHIEGRPHMGAAAPNGSPTFAKGVTSCNMILAWCRIGDGSPTAY